MALAGAGLGAGQALGREKERDGRIDELLRARVKSGAVNASIEAGVKRE